MILEKKLNLKNSLENLLSKIPPTNAVSPIIERRYMLLSRNNDFTLLEKLWFLDGTLKDLSVFSGIGEVSEWLNETKSFFVNNNVSVKASVICAELKNNKDSAFYNNAVSILERLLITHDEDTLPKAILENLSEYTWISNMRELIEECVKITRGVSISDGKIAISKVFSPISIFENGENEEYTFHSSGRYLKYVNGKIVPASSSSVDNVFHNLVGVSEKFQIFEDRVEVLANSKNIRIDNSTSTRKIYFDDEEIQPAALEAAMFSVGSLFGKDRVLTGMIASVYENFDSLLNIDFATKLSSRVNEGINMIIFKTEKCIAVQKINPYMNENLFLTDLTPQEAISEAKEFLNFDISTLFTDLTQSAEKQKNELSLKVRELQENAVFILNRKEKTTRQAIELGVETTPEMVSVLEGLESEYESLLMNIQSIYDKIGRFDNVLEGSIYTNVGNKKVEFKASDYLSESKSIKVCILPDRNTIMVDRTEIGISL